MDAGRDMPSTSCGRTGRREQAWASWQCGLPLKGALTYLPAYFTYVCNMQDNRLDNCHTMTLTAHFT